MVRLVKGAYWDTEIKRAQVDGLDGYPVFTRKVAHRRRPTSPARASCSPRRTRSIRSSRRTTRRRSPRSTRWPGRSTRRASSSSSACTAWARRCTTQVVGPRRGQARPPVPHLRAGRHARDAARLSRAPAARERRQHLVRQPHRRSRGADRRAGRRSGRACACARCTTCGPPHPRIPLPRDAVRASARELARARPRRRARARPRCATRSPRRSIALDARSRRWRARRRARGACRCAIPPTAATRRHGGRGRRRGRRGRARRPRGAPSRLGTRRRRRRARRASSAPPTCCEARCRALLGLHRARGGQDAAPNAVAEVREAVDFLRYYAGEARARFDNATHRAARPGGLHQPVEFPAGDLHRPGRRRAGRRQRGARQARRADAADRRRGRAPAARGGRAARRRCSCCPARRDGRRARWSPIRASRAWCSPARPRSRALIQRALAARLTRDGQPVPLIAETGGQNAMIVDSSALPEQVVADASRRRSTAPASAARRCACCACRRTIADACSRC